MVAIMYDANVDDLIWSLQWHIFWHDEDEAAYQSAGSSEDKLHLLQMNEFENECSSKSELCQFFGICLKEECCSG